MSGCSAIWTHPNSIAALPVSWCSGRPILSPLSFPLPLLARVSDDQEFNFGIRDQTQQYPNKVTTLRMSLVHIYRRQSICVEFVTKS